MLDYDLETKYGDKRQVENVKLCVHCKNFNPRGSLCSNHTVVKKNLVNGKQFVKVSMAAGYARKTPTDCGLEAKFFEPTLKYKVLKCLKLVQI